MNNTKTINAVALNFHLLAPCNMVCRGCFAHLKEYRKYDSHVSAILRTLTEIDRLTRQYLSRKITFSGGEPTLLPNLPEVIRVAKYLGFTTSIVTNGATLNIEWLRKVRDDLDWIGISVDSLSKATNVALGRIVADKPMSCKKYSHLADLIHGEGYKLKVNTVISKHNIQEDFNEWIRQIVPERWKVMQALILRGENDGFRNFIVSKHEYLQFIKRHIGVNPIAESAEDMIDSYVMVSPDGTLLINSLGGICHGPKLREMSAQDFYQWYFMIHKRLVQRGGMYIWNKNGNDLDKNKKEFLTPNSNKSIFQTSKINPYFGEGMGLDQANLLI